MRAVAGALAMLAVAQGAQAACIADGAAVTGRFEWQSLTRPSGKPIPAPYLLLDIPVCVHAGTDTINSGVLRLFPRDDAALQGLHAGDALIVIANYKLPDDFKANGDIGAYDAQIVRQ